MKFVKVIFSDKSRYNSFQYQIDKVNIAPHWNKDAKTPEEMGGLNYSNEENILRYLHNGDIIYDVEVPEDAETVIVEGCATPRGVFRSNKIIVKNPRKVTDEMALEFYKKTTIPESAFPKALGSIALMDYYTTANTIFNEKVNKENIDYYISEWDDFMSKKSRKDSNKTVIEIDRKLKEYIK